jgi:hypothetical protein
MDGQASLIFPAFDGSLVSPEKRANFLPGVQASVGSAGKVFPGRILGSVAKTRLLVVFCHFPRCPELSLTVDCRGRVIPIITLKCKAKARTSRAPGFLRDLCSAAQPKASRDTSVKITRTHLLGLVALIGLAAVLVAIYLHSTPVLELSKPDRERIESLDDALKNGMISQTEYKYRVAQIRSGAAHKPDDVAPDAAPPSNSHSPDPPAAEQPSKTNVP